MDDNLSRLLQIIKKDKPQEDHFFRKLASIEDPIRYLKAVKDAGYFSPQNNPGPVALPKKNTYSIPIWNILGYLENVAKVNRKKSSEDVSNTLVEIINNIIRYTDKNGKRIDNYRTDWSIGKIIFLLPVDKIEDIHFEFIRSTFDSNTNISLSSEIGKTFLPNLLESKNISKILKLLGIVLDYKNDKKGKYDPFTSIMDDYWLEKLLDLNKEKIAELCSIEAGYLALNKITEIIESDKTQFNRIWIPTIEEHDQTELTDKYEIQLVYFVRDMFHQTQPEKLLNIIGNLIKREHSIFKRIAIHTIQFHYDKLESLFWDLKKNPLENYEIKHELFELFQNRSINFTPDQLTRIIDWIEKKDYPVSQDNQENSNLIIAYKKKEWLSALLECKNPLVDKLFKKYDEINPSELEHPGFDFWSESGWAVDESPISEAQLLSLSIEETVNYLNEFNDEPGWQKPNLNGLANTFEQCIQNNPLKYDEYLNQFLVVKQIFQNAIISGFNIAWNNQLEFNQKSVFEFILNIIKGKEFWDKTFEPNAINYRDWLISEITGFIDNGTRKDDHAFKIEFENHIEEILLILVEKYQDKNVEILDLITTVLNSPKGKIFSSLILFSLRHARTVSGKDSIKWLSSIQNDFTNRLDKSFEDSLDFSVILGQYLRNLYYLNEQWVEENFEKIFPIDFNKYWEAAIIGYFYHASSVNQNIYIKFKSNGHFSKAIYYNFEQQPIKERIVEHICVGFLEGWEKIGDNNSLIVKIIESKQNVSISSIIRFFVRAKDNLSEKFQSKVKPLWRKLNNTLLENENKELLSELGEFLALVDEIDEEIYQWMIESTKYFESSHETYTVVENLAKHVDNSPNFVGELFLNIIDSGYYPYYKEEEIRKIIETVGMIDRAMGIQICNKYLIENYTFVRESLEKIKRNE